MSDRLTRLKNLVISQYGQRAPKVSLFIEDACWLVDRAERFVEAEQRGHSLAVAEAIACLEDIGKIGSANVLRERFGKVAGK